MKFRLMIDKDKEEEVVITAHRRTTLIDEIEALVEKHAGMDRIPAYTGESIKMLSFADIECITVLDGKTYAIDKEGEKYRLKQRLYELESLLPSFFIRINKSALANETRLDRFAVTYSGAVDAVFRCGYREYVSRRKMKAFWKDFLFRGLIASAGGPLVLAIIYGVLGATGAVDTLSPYEVCLGIVTITLLAFTVAGMTAIYQVESLPLASAILIHGGALYGLYLVIYLINGWLQQSLVPILVFTGIFVLVYILIWVIIYSIERSKIKKINELRKKA